MNMMYRGIKIQQKGNKYTFNVLGKQYAFEGEDIEPAIKTIDEDLRFFCENCNRRLSAKERERVTANGRDFLVYTCKNCGDKKEYLI